MKKTYIQPETLIDMAEACEMLAASMLTTGDDNQSVDLTDDEWDGEFSTKESTGIDW